MTRVRRTRRRALRVFKGQESETVHPYGGVDAPLTDASFGLLIAPLADGHWDRAGKAFSTVLDSLEPGWHTAV